VLCRFTAFVAADVQVVNEGGVVHRVLQPVEAPAGWTMFDRVAMAAAAMPMARMSVGGLQAAGPVARRATGPRGPAGPLGKADARLGAITGRVGPGRAARRRSRAFAPLGGADLAPYRRRAAQLATLLESDRPLPRLWPTAEDQQGPGSRPGLGPQGPGQQGPGQQGPGPQGPGPQGPGAGLAGSPSGLVGDDLRRRLGLVRVGLEALVADLESVDAVEEEAGPLRELARELEGLTGPVVVQGPQLEELREWALAVLRAFAAAGDPFNQPDRQPPTPAPGMGPRSGRRRGPEFWKR
jgi:hypothetical protein